MLQMYNSLDVLQFQQIVPSVQEDRNKEQEQQSHDKIVMRLKQTFKNNKNKQFFKRLIFRNCQIDYLPAISYNLLSSLPQLKYLKQLNLSEMRLRSLRNLPQFNYLTNIDLTMNNLVDSQIIYIFKFRNLELLYLTQNYITLQSTVESLKNLPKLVQLDVSSNPVQYDRSKLFIIIPSLKIMDRYTSTGKDLQKKRSLYNANSQSQQQSEQQEQQEQEQEQAQEEEEMCSNSDQKSNQEQDEQIQEEQEKSDIVYDSDIQNQPIQFLTAQNNAQGNMMNQHDEMDSGEQIQEQYFSNSQDNEQEMVNEIQDKLKIQEKISQKKKTNRNFKNIKNLLMRLA